MRSARKACLGLSLGQVGIFETPTVGRLVMTRSLLKTPGGGRVGGQLKIFGKGRENVMKSLLFFTAAVLLLVGSTVAFAIGDSVFERSDKWSGGERFPPLPPPQAAASAGCHNVKVRIATHNGHAVYKTHRICA